MTLNICSTAHMKRKGDPPTLKPAHVQRSDVYLFQRGHHYMYLSHKDVLYVAVLT